MAELVIKQFYDETLTKHEQQVCRNKFCIKFNVNRNCFYTTLRGDNISTDRLKFFADFFACSIDELFNQIKPVKNGHITAKEREYNFD